MRSTTGSVEFLHELAKGMDLTTDGTDQRSRDYLLRILASPAGEDAVLCRVDGVRWFSPATILIGAVNDLADHSSDQQKAVREFLCARIQALAPPGDPPSVRWFCEAFADWLDTHSPACDGG